jgi:hypothetical protein
VYEGAAHMRIVVRILREDITMAVLSFRSLTPLGLTLASSPKKRAVVNTIADQRQGTRSALVSTTLLAAASREFIDQIAASGLLLHPAHFDAIDRDLVGAQAVDDERGRAVGRQPAGHRHVRK